MRAGKDDKAKCWQCYKCYDCGRCPKCEICRCDQKHQCRLQRKCDYCPNCHQCEFYCRCSMFLTKKTKKCWNCQKCEKCRKCPKCQDCRCCQKCPGCQKCPKDVECQCPTFFRCQKGYGLTCQKKEDKMIGLGSSDLSLTTEVASTRSPYGSSSSDNSEKGMVFGTPLTPDLVSTPYEIGNICMQARPKRKVKDSFIRFLAQLFL